MWPPSPPHVHPHPGGPEALLRSVEGAEDQVEFAEHLVRRHVIDGKDVRRIGHRHQQCPVVEEGHRNGRIALRRVRVDQVGRAHVWRESREVDVFEPVALGERPAELLCRDDAAVDQQIQGDVFRVGVIPLEGGVAGERDAAGGAEPAATYSEESDARTSEGRCLAE